MNTYIIETTEDNLIAGLEFSVRYGQQPADRVQYAIFENKEQVTPWRSTPFQSVNIKRGDACRLVSEWLDECGG